MKNLAASLALAASLIAGSASAAGYTFAFTAPGVTLTGSLSTASSASPALISSLTGTYNGSAISLVAPNGVSLLPSNDDKFFANKSGFGQTVTTGGYLDYDGLGFSSAGSVYNLFFVGGSEYDIQKVGTSTSAAGTFSIASVSAAPEPGTWALMLGGAGIMGAMLRVVAARRREDEMAAL